jgi:hypothetical protein
MTDWCQEACEFILLLRCDYGDLRASRSLNLVTVVDQKFLDIVLLTFGDKAERLLQQSQGPSAGRGRGVPRERDTQSAPATLH